MRSALRPRNRTTHSPGLLRRLWENRLAVGAFLVWLVLLAALVRQWADEYRTGRALTVTAGKDIDALTVVAAGDLHLPASDTQKRAAALEPIVGRIAVRPIKKGDRLTKGSTELGPAGPLRAGARLLTLPAAGSIDWLTAGRVVTLILVPANDADAPAAPAGGDNANTLVNVRILTVGKQGDDGHMPLLVEVPSEGQNHATLNRLVGRATAYPVFVTPAPAELGGRSPGALTP